MNVLVLSSRFPWPAYTGDRLRAAIWLEALGAHANVALVAPEGSIPAEAPPFRFHAARRSVRQGIAGALRLLGGGSVSALLAAPYDWADAIRRAEADLGRIDTTVVLLSRLDPWVRALLPDGFHVLDAIDSLRLNMEERSRQAPPWLRWFWRVESRRVGRIEADAADTYDRVVVVSPDDAGELDAETISNGVSIAPLVEAPRPFDYGFWGRLSYFANADAAAWLLGEIWPAVRAQRPEATLLLAGSDAPPFVRAAHGANGVTVQSPVEDMAALVRQVRVALLPIRYGSGQSNKVLEAAEAGCGIVATPQAVRGLASLTPYASIGRHAGELARLALLPSPAAMARSLRHVVETQYARTLTLDQLAALALRREAAA
ncbi:MAG TPA: glycosyltransferase family 4 protein [Thermoanaerobaculia bacterium]